MKAHFTLTKKDFEYQWFSGTGAGGQHRNKHQNCFRIKHIATGIIKTGQSNRDRDSNKREAMLALKKDPRFISWCDLRLREIEMGATIEEQVDAMMLPENIQVNVKDAEGRWVPEKLSTSA